MQVACGHNRTAVRPILVNEDAAWAAAVNSIHHINCMDHSSDNCCASCSFSASQQPTPFLKSALEIPATANSPIL